MPSREVGQIEADPPKQFTPATKGSDTMNQEAKIQLNPPQSLLLLQLPDAEKEPSRCQKEIIRWQAVMLVKINNTGYSIPSKDSAVERVSLPIPQCFTNSRELLRGAVGWEWAFSTLIWFPLNLCSRYSFSMRAGRVRGLPFYPLRLIPLMPSSHLCQEGFPKEFLTFEWIPHKYPWL